MRAKSLDVAAVALLVLIGTAGCHPPRKSEPQSLEASARNEALQSKVEVTPARSIEPPTYVEDIAPIIHSQCSSCHRPGQAGPFSLLSYSDVMKRKRTIAGVTKTRYMPPWKPVNDDVEFENDRRLSAQQLATIQAWVAAGGPRGDGPEPAPPAFPEGWSLGEPDLVVRMNGEFEVPASGPDIYRSFVFPLELDEDRWIKAIEYRPAAVTSVHHALFFVDRSGNARAIDGADGSPGIDGMSFLSAPASAASGSSAGFENPLGAGLGGYAPGTTPTRLPQDLAFPLPAGSDIVMQTHFHPSGRTEVERGELGIYFADAPPSRTLVPIQIPAMFGVGAGIRIPAGESEYVVEESFVLPVEVDVINVSAHAHYLGRTASMVATLPDGGTITLLEIDDWDLDWQDRYTFREPVVLPAGTKLTSRVTYDNSANNRENPFSPPREVRWGRESTDEMGSVSVYAVARESSGHAQLASEVQRYTVQSLTQGDVIDLLMQLDTNHDGGLQRSEAPPRMGQRFGILDRNGDDKLDREELEIIRRFLPIPKAGD